MQSIETAKQVLVTPAAGEYRCKGLARGAVTAWVNERLGEGTPEALVAPAGGVAGQLPGRHLAMTWAPQPGAARWASGSASRSRTSPARSPARTPCTTCAPSTASSCPSPRRWGDELHAAAVEHLREVRRVHGGAERARPLHRRVPRHPGRIPDWFRGAWLASCPPPSRWRAGETESAHLRARQRTARKYLLHHPLRHQYDPIRRGVRRKTRPATRAYPPCCRHGSPPPIAQPRATPQSRFKTRS